MSDIQHIIGDVTHPIGEGIKFIAHCCNNEGKWGKGVVLAISKRWSMPELIYRKWFNERPEEMRDSLGKVQIVPVEKDIMVVNIIGQNGTYHYKKNPKPIDYDAIQLGLKKICLVASKHKNPSLHIPRLGAGLAKGEWSKIEKIIKETVSMPVFVYTLKSEVKKYGMKK